MAVPSTPAPTPPYNIGGLEGGLVSFLGAFAGAFALAGGSIEGSVFAGIGAFAAYLGYHAYQSS